VKYFQRFITILHLATKLSSNNFAANSPLRIIAMLVLLSVENQISQKISRNDEHILNGNDHSLTSRKVVGSIPEEVIRFFI
jgi:hypothetical protein